VFVAEVIWDKRKQLKPRQIEIYEIKTNGEQDREEVDGAFDAI